MSRFPHYPNAPAADAVRNAFHDPVQCPRRRLLVSRHLRGDQGNAPGEGSFDQVLRVASYFDIPSTALATDPKLLDRIFGARNEIVHEMDVDFAQTNRNRRPRRKAVMIDHTTEVLRLANAFLIEVDRGLGRTPAGEPERR